MGIEINLLIYCQFLKFLIRRFVYFSVILFIKSEKKNSNLDATIKFAIRILVAKKLPKKENITVLLALSPSKLCEHLCAYVDSEQLQGLALGLVVVFRVQ
jgi:hypothetical protein